MPEQIVELDDTPPPQRRRSDRFIVGALLSGSLVFGVTVAVVHPSARPSTEPAPATTAYPSIAPLPSQETIFHVQPPLFRPGTPFPRPSPITLPVPGVWQSGKRP